jgi:hypothetical protein
MFMGTALRFGAFVLGGAAMILTLGGCPQRIAPTVSSTSPAGGATNVAIARKITATFSQVMNPATITTATFTLTQGTTPVSGAVSYTGVTAVFSPTTVLAPNTVYTATITTGAETPDHDRKSNVGSNKQQGSKGLFGGFFSHNHALRDDFVWTFTTGPDPDTIAPTVSFTAPTDGSIGVLLGRNLSATFSEAMDPSTITTATFTLNQDATPISGTVTYAGFTATFNPASPLAPSTEYTATITTGTADLAGNALFDDYIWTITTGVAADTTAPKVSFTDPVNPATGVPTNKKIAATFSEAMDPLTITAATFTLTRGGSSVLGTVTYVGVTATFTPINGLLADSQYIATISTGARDLAGNPLEVAYWWSFTTGASSDITAPEVSFTNPVNPAINVPINQKVAATFSEVLDPLTITTATFTLDRGITPVAGTVTYAGVTATFAPTGGLAPATEYTATISTDVADLAGNTLENTYVWTFTTGGDADITAPEVFFTDPVNVALNVPVNKKVAVTFTEAMDPLTITAATFTLDRGLTPVEGTVTYSGITATFTPPGGLVPNTTYTGTVSMEATDLAGNTLPGIYVWTFTTGESTDVTAPSVFFTDPVNVAVDVPVDDPIDVTFDEFMDPLTVTTATFRLAIGATPVSGTVIYTGIIATFTPAVELAPNTTFTATILMEATDLAGNTLPDDYVWTFTTGASR